MKDFDKPRFKQKALKGPPRRGINWIKEEWPILNKKLVAVKRYIQRTQAGSRRVSSVEVLDYLLDLYIKLNPDPGLEVVDNEDNEDDE